MNAATVTFLRRSGSLRLLVLEPEVLVRCSTSEALRAEGYKVLEASSGQEALAILQSVPVHLLLADVQMPGPIGGLAVARFAQALTPAPRIILAGTAPCTRPDASELGPFIRKPYKLEQVIDLVTAALDPTSGSEPLR